MTRFALLPCLGLLAACVGGPTGQVVRPPEGTQVIELYSGGTFSGSYSTSIYANDVVASEQIDQKGKMQRKVVQGRPGVFEAALAVLRAEGPAAAKATAHSRDTYDCMDYGSDSVSIKPAIPGFSDAIATCPEEPLLALHRHVLATLATPE
jgi:hypothetical protein